MRHFALHAFFYITVCVFCSSHLSYAAVSIVVETKSGAVAGEVNGTLYGSGMLGRPNVASFMGIPYAQPPIGIHRFRPPEPHPPWQGVLKAKAPGPVCAQLPLISAVDLPQRLWPSTTEDCLYLNLWAPTDKNGSFQDKKPVLIFLHGGAFMTGSGYQEIGMPFYNAQGLSDDTQTVVVTLNYRLGVFGLLADPALLAESGTTGNYGLQDQRAAMSWIQRNTLSFGGDPVQITIIGESAGAASVLHHAVLPRSSGLFAQVISESGYDKTWPLEVAYSAGQEIAAHVECHEPSSRLECLRNASAKTLLEAQAKVFFSNDFISRALFFGPVSDGYELPENVTFAQAVKAAKPRIPLLVGSNLNETNLFLCLDKSLHKLTWQDAPEYLLARIRVVVPGLNATQADMQQLLQHYQHYSTPGEAIMALTTDFLFTCGARRTARAFAASGTPVYRYLFSRPPALFRVDRCLGVPHTAELNLLFRDAFPRPVQRFVVGDAAEQQLADFMVSAWGNFAWGRVPAYSWPKWNSSQPLLQLGDADSGKLTTLFDYRSDECSMMDALMTVGDKQTTADNAESASGDTIVV